MLPDLFRISFAVSGGDSVGGGGGALGGQVVSRRQSLIYQVPWAFTRTTGRGTLSVFVLGLF
jgi:hypothetical protein